VAAPLTRLERALARLGNDLDDLDQRCALVGGLAVSARAEPRTTRDIDLAIAVVDEAARPGARPRRRRRRRLAD
jgi:hypothetical protein